MVEGTGEKIIKNPQRMVADYFPEAPWVENDMEVKRVERLPDNVVGDYDWETRQLRVSKTKVKEWADDVILARRRVKAEEFREMVDRKWSSWNEETRRSAIMTYLYLRALNKSMDSEDVLVRNFETEVVAHEARHAYDDKQSYKEKIGLVGPVEALALLTQLEHSPVYERTLFVACIEPYCLQEAENYEPVSLQDEVGVEVMKIFLGFAELENPRVSNQRVSDKIKHLAFLPEKKFKELCTEVRTNFEQLLYSSSGQVA